MIQIWDITVTGLLQLLVPAAQSVKMSGTGEGGEPPGKRQCILPLHDPLSNPAEDTPNLGPARSLASSANGEDEGAEHTATVTTDVDSRDHVPDAVDIATTLGVAPGTRLEVLWEVERFEGDTQNSVWWPCTVLTKTDSAVKLELELDNPELQYVVVYEVRYDAIPEFPEWQTSAELTAHVAFTEEHELFTAEVDEGFHAWRFAGDSWVPLEESECSQQDDLSLPSDVTPEMAGQALVDDLMTHTVLPMFKDRASGRDAATQSVIAGILCRARVGSSF